MHQASPGYLLPVGTVIRPHGSVGLLRIWPYARSEASFMDVEVVHIRPASGKIYEHKLISLKPHKNIFLMNLEGIGTKDQAEKYRGAEILVSKEALSCKKDEYFWHELLGFDVYIDTEEYLGCITQVISTGGNDIYVVKQGTKEILIPATYEVVKKIDLEKKKMIITPMEGLLDLNEV